MGMSWVFFVFYCCASWSVGNCLMRLSILSLTFSFNLSICLLFLLSFPWVNPFWLWLLSFPRCFGSGFWCWGLVVSNPHPYIRGWRLSVCGNTLLQFFRVTECSNTALLLRSAVPPLKVTKVLRHTVQQSAAAAAAVAPLKLKVVPGQRPGQRKVEMVPTGDHSAERPKRVRYEPYNCRGAARSAMAQLGYKTRRSWRNSERYDRRDREEEVRRPRDCGRYRYNERRERRRW